jgi:hypothetical protein
MKYNCLWFYIPVGIYVILSASTLTVGCLLIIMTAVIHIAVNLSSVFSMIRDIQIRILKLLNNIKSDK